jgi:hypothetical protein
MRNGPLPFSALQRRLLLARLGQQAVGAARRVGMVAHPNLERDLPRGGLQVAEGEGSEELLLLRLVALLVPAMRLAA